MVSNNILDRFTNWERYLFTEGSYQDISDEYVQFDKKIIISDCDGILTDGGHYYTEEGKVMKKFGSCDKEAMRFMIKCGWKVMFVTDDPTGYKITQRRMQDWEVQYLPKRYLTDCKYYDRTSVFVPDVNYKTRREIVKKFKKEGWFVLFIGDSMSDIEAGKEADVFFTVNNSVKPVKICADWCTEKDGGSGGFASIMYYAHCDLGSKYTGIPMMIEKGVLYAPNKHK